MPDATETNQTLPESATFTLTRNELALLNGVFKCFCDFVGQGRIAISEEDDVELSALFNKIVGAKPNA